MSTKSSMTTATSVSSLFSTAPAESGSTLHSVLVVGATGELGTEIIQRLALDAPFNQHKRSVAQVPVFGMSRDLQSVPQHVMAIHRRHTEALIDGDPMNASDLQRALLMSRADTIVVTNPGKDGKEYNRAVGSLGQEKAIAKRLARLLAKDSRSQHVRIIVASWSTCDPYDDSSEESWSLHNAIDRFQIAVVRPSTEDFKQARHRQRHRRFRAARSKSKRFGQQEVPPSAVSSVARRIVDEVCVGW